MNGDILADQWTQLKGKLKEILIASPMMLCCRSTGRMIELFVFGNSATAMTNCYVALPTRSEPRRIR